MDNKEYIERGALFAELRRMPAFERSEADKRMFYIERSVLESFPTADVVEVVRCKDCRHKNELNKYEKTIYADGCVACSFISATGDRLVMLGDAFCNYGEKIDGKGEGE